jgi:hypothetical protein
MEDVVKAPPIRRLLTASACFAILLAVATHVAAQPAAPDQPPAITVGLGLGFLLPVNHHVPIPSLDGETYTPLYSAVPFVSGTMRVPLGRSVFVEGEVSVGRASGSRSLTSYRNPAPWPQPDFGRPRVFVIVDGQESRHAVTATASIGYRLGTARLSHFVAAGLAATRTAGARDATWRCEPLQVGGCDRIPTGEWHDRGASVLRKTHLNWGVDVGVTPRLAAYADARWAAFGRTPYDGGSKSGFGATSGVRVAVGDGMVLPPAARDERHPIRTGSLMGMLVGSWVGIAAAHGSNHDDVRLAAPATMMIWGLGVGALAGLIADKVDGK